MNSMKRQNDRILKEELPRSVGAQYATGDQWCTKLAFESDIMNITVRDIELLTAKSLNTDRTTSVKTACAYIYIIAILHFKDAA